MQAYDRWGYVHTCTLRPDFGTCNRCRRPCLVRVLCTTHLYTTVHRVESKEPSAMVVLCRLAVFTRGFWCTRADIHVRVYLHCTSRQGTCSRCMHMSKSMVAQNGESIWPSLMVVLYSLAVLIYMRFLVHMCRHMTRWGYVYIPALYVQTSGPATGADDHVYGGGWRGCCAQLSSLLRATK